MRQLALIIAVFIALLLSAALGQGRSKDSLDRCSPTWMRLSGKQPISTSSGPYTVSFSAILIGCEENLGKMKDVDLRRAQKALKALLGEHSIDLIGISESKELRRSAVAAMNKALGRPAIGDVFFAYLSVGEAM